MKPKEHETTGSHPGRDASGLVEGRGADGSGRPRLRRGGWVILGLTGVALVVGLAAAVPLDGEMRPAWRLAGRLHPLLVHLPVALLPVVVLLELGARRRPAWADSAALLLRFSVVGAYAAAFTGLALVNADGHAGAGVRRHLWGGVAVTVATMLCWLARGRAPGRLYPGLLAATVGIFGWAAHQGGNLTHGEFYLTEALPPPVRRFLRLPEAPTPETYAPDTVFGAAIRPMLERHCFSCHGPTRQRGGYRMDAFSLLVVGGQSGAPALAAGEPERSELLRRMLLPAADKKAMPPQGQPRPKETDIALLRWWVTQGASRDLTLAEAGESDPAFVALLQAAVPTETTSRRAPHVADYSALGPEISRLAAELNVVLVPQSKQTGAGLVLRTRNREEHFNNDTLARLAPLAPFIVEAELRATRIDDDGIKLLSTWRNLVHLDLSRTNLSGKTFDSLAGLPRLESIILYGSALTDEGLAQLARLKALRTLYAIDSAVTTVGLVAFRSARPDCRVPLPEPVPVFAPREIKPSADDEEP